MLNVPVGHVKVTVRATVYEPTCALFEVLIMKFEFVESKIVKLEAKLGVNV